MPGTIHVSVLDFKEIPSSSSSILVKGVETMAIMEKGFWDEFLPLAGGGHVHMKLQFVLTEEERNRIRSMRETAMKKKRSELLNSSLRCSETATAAGDTGTPSTCINDEVSDVPNASSSQDLAVHDGTLSNPESAAGNEEGTGFHQIQITPNDTDGSEETSSAASPEVNHDKPVQKSETKSRHVNVPERPKFLQEGSSTTKKNLVASEWKNDWADHPEKQDPLGKTPSNVRKMITAFESSPAKDMRPGTEPQAAKPQSNKVGMEAPKDLNLKEITKPAKLTSGRLKNPFLTGELQEIQTHERKRVGHVGFDKETESTAKHEWRKRQEDLERMSAVEAATISGSIHEEHSGLHQPLSVNQHDSGGTAVMEGCGNGIHSSKSHEISIQGSSEHNLKSAAFCENEHSFSESPGAWIFPDHARHLCITTGSKQVMELVGGCAIHERRDRGKKSFSFRENVEKRSTQFGAYTEVKNGDKTSHELRKSRLESSSEVETSAGLVGQAIKVAVMVAFGTLVLLTRQRKPR